MLFDTLKREKELHGKLGAIPSPIDKRDYKLTSLLAYAPIIAPVYEPKIMGPVLNQGQSSQCVACSLSLVKYIIEKRQTDNSKLFSTNYIYGNRAATDDKGEGMYPRQAIKTLVTFGVPHKVDTEVFLSYGEAVEFYQNNKIVLDKEARPYRISSYYALHGNNEIKQAIQTIGAVSGMFPVFDCIYETGTDGIINYESSRTQHNYGYHEMTLIGWNNNKKSWIVQNSWGEQWGDKGLCYLPYDYPIVEAWAIVDDIIEKNLKEN